MSTLGEASAVNMGERLRVLAVTGDSRAAPFMDVPTFKELGYPEIPSLAYSLNAPRGIQKATIDKLYGAAARSLQQDDVRARFAKVGMTTVGESPEAAIKGG
jgi:tripartite-type tricarboxylate transporter receptor subunit TctC